MPRLSQRAWPEASAFRQRVEELAGDALAPGAPVALGVSGGSDSLALLLLAADAFGTRAQPLTVDHGLRPESAGEASLVAKRAASLGLGHATLRLEAPPGPANLQAEARDGRYAAMADWCREQGVRVLLTAHQMDDQAETLLMRMNRGAGLAGLAGIRARVWREGVLVVRPLLDHPRAALAALVAAAGWQPVDDPSNHDPHFDRARARGLLAGIPGLSPARLAASAGHLAEAEDALEWASERAFASRAARTGAALLLDVEPLPAELQRRLLSRALAALGAPAPAGPALARFQAALCSGRPATLAGIAGRPAGGGLWRLEPAPPRRGQSQATRAAPS